VASATISKKIDIADMIASEMMCGVERAVECWMSQIEQAVTDAHLTSLGRLNAVTDIVHRYKYLTGKVRLEGRKDVDRHEL
jgi:hypothetical protein